MRDAVPRSSAQALFDSEIANLRRLTHKVFGVLLPAQWAFAVACAVWVSPLSWSADRSSLHAHVIAAVALGGLLTVFPLWLMHKRPEQALTRDVAATAQMLFSALLIHLMGGRIEAHFHVFGSLALLAFFRDYRVFVPAVGVTFIDHLVRGLYWPESVFGVVTPSAWRAFEHAGWVLFECGFLAWGVAQSRGHLRNLAGVQASLAEERDGLERRVAHRTEELAVARDYFANVIDSLDAHLCILDHDGRILTTNHAWRGFGESRGAIDDQCGEGANYLEVCRSAQGDCGEDASQLADTIERVIRGERDRVVVEYPCHEPDRERWFQARVSPFVGGKTAAVVVAHVEVTERVLANRASLEESRRAESLARIISESPNELYIFNQEHLRFEVVNDGAVTASGYSREELLDMSPIDLKPDFDEPAFRALLEPLRRSEVDVLEFQTEHVRRDGSVYPVQVSLHTAEYNSTPVYVAFITDLSELRQLESRLLQARKLESIGQLAAGIAHEINTPMQCIANNVQFLTSCQENLFEVVDHLIALLEGPGVPWQDRRASVEQLIEQLRYQKVAMQAPAALVDAAEASHRVVEIVRAMKAMSHPGARKKMPVDVNAVIRDAATIAKNRWKYVARLELDLDEAAPAIPAYSAELSQVFLNLLVNAADAISDRHGAEAQGLIRVRSWAEEDCLRIEVEDDGAGVPASIRDKLFDPFFTTKGVGRGTGQGLAITYDVVVNKHGGVIDVLSTEGEGTTFVLHLPLDDDEEGAPLAVEEHPAAASD